MTTITIWLHEPTLMMWKLKYFPHKRIDFIMSLRNFHKVHNEPLSLNHARILVDFYWEQWNKEIV